MTRRTLGNRKLPPANTGDFVGRANEQQLFRATLRELERQRAVADEELPEDLPYAQIFLVAAEGGMGKTRLMRRFADIVAEDSERANATAIYLDLETYHKRSPIGRDIERFLEVLHLALGSAGFADELEPFRQERERRNAIHRRATDLAQEYNLQLSLGGRAAEPDNGLMNRDPAREGDHAAGKLADAARAFIKRRLGDDEWRIFDDPFALTKKLMECVNKIATPERPLVLLLDTYEVADACDSWLREELLSETGPRLVWAIAGRANTEWFQAYETTFQAASNALRKIPLSTFVANDIEAYLDNHGVEPAAGLVAQLNGLSRGVPLALEAWVNLYRKGEPLPEPDRDSRSYRDVVRQVTERFLRYCGDDKLFDDGAREQRRTLRETILSFLLLRRTDHAALAAMWQCSRMDAERRLDDLRDQFSFIFADSVTRTPHGLVKEFTCEDMRRNPLRESVAECAERLRGFTAARITQREGDIHGQPAAAPLAPAERARLNEKRATLQEQWYDCDLQITQYTQRDAPVGLLGQRRDLERQLTEIDTRLADEQPASTPAGPRRPLWEDEEWGDWLLDHLNALAWCDRSGEKVLKLAVPLLVESIAFNGSQAAAIIDALEPAATVWRDKHQQTFDALKQGRWKGRWATTSKEMRAILSSLEQYQFTPLQQAILKLLEAGTLSEDGHLAEATSMSDAAAALLPDGGGELGELFGTTYAQIGGHYLWPNNARDAVKSPEGLEALHKAMNYHPGNAGSWYSLGTAEHRLGNLEQASAAHQQAISLDPTDAYPHNGLGNVYRKLNQNEAAIAAYQQAITLDPAFAYPHNGLGLIYEEQEQYELAIKSYQRAADLDPTYASPHRNLGDVYRKLDQNEAAIAAYQQAITLDPAFAYPHNGLGLIYEEQEQYELAIKSYQQAVDLDPTLANPYQNLGNTYRKIHQYDKAIVAYEQAIALDPSSTSAHTSLGDVFNLIGQLSAAEEHYRSAIAIDLQAYRPLAALARLAYQRGDPQAAQEWAKPVRALLPVGKYYDHACLESIIGNTEAALQLLQLALETGEQPKDWARTDPDFIFIRADPRFQALVSDEG